MTVASKQLFETNGLNGNAHNVSDEAPNGKPASSVQKGNNWQEPGPAAFDFRSMFDTMQITTSKTMIINFVQVIL